MFNDLRNRAKRERRLTDELLPRHVQEGFLRRLSESDHRDRFVLKGGLLLSVLDARRPTRDADLLGQGIDCDEDSIVSAVLDITGLPVDDGIEFDGESRKTSVIRDDDEYGGLRIVIPATVAHSQLRLQLDVSFGDPVTPGARRISYPAQVGEAFPLLVYPVETVVAEKTVTAMQRGDANSRVRDYADLWRLSGVHAFAGADLITAVERTARHRALSRHPLAGYIDDLPRARARAYGDWRRKQGPDRDAYPEDFAQVVAEVVAFADPLLVGEIVGAEWDPDARSWRR
ncbi:nucleotidyl transferase AbiEii/AbiGii toxin family protein [Actinoallomurus soli]|uniref:nucleotidyl transferase AbiEii/AbiGii toxin family protein n=1 Tax=Actinoallomurus soli TaxID=2952535 RepID=UPI0020934B98|nr:nucleotidyl transferase AbiEii/AbiGii toxin family protein [Actinoallomurus soli]MCO5971796.1 nucleotidyl transferase AbiEii/AbiGii toxin family protein [Actinoallomurus soli]